MNSRIDSEGLGGLVSESELVSMAVGHRAAADRLRALKTLVRLQSATATPVLQQILADRQAPAELRGTAALALGRTVDPDSIGTLVEALDGGDPPVIRRVAEVLGRIGDARALAALQRLERGRDAATDRAVRFARTLIAYRLGVDAERLASPASHAMLPLGGAPSASLVFEPLAAAALRKAMPRIREILPAVPVSAKAGLTFQCGGEHLALVVADADGNERLSDRLRRRQAVAAVLLKASACGDDWYVHELVLSHPTDRPDQAEAFGLRPSGRLLHHGIIDLVESRARVELRALNTALAPALEFSTDYDAATQRFSKTRARVASVRLDRQVRPAAPRPAGAPSGVAG